MLDAKDGAKAAVIDSDTNTAYSYARLLETVIAFGKKILDEPLVADSPVAILIPRGFEFYACQLAVLSAKAFFLPIDPANPVERIEFLIRDSGARSVLVCKSTLEKIGHLSKELRLIDVGAEVWTAPQLPQDEDGLTLPLSHGADDLAYMIYTSGSTGLPKGVPIHWGAIHNHNDWFIEEFGIGPEDRCLQMASVGFDISLEEIFTTLRSGATLFPISENALDTPVGFFKWVQQQQLTVLNIPTALWHNLVPALEHVRLADSVRLVLIGGEQVQSKHVAQWFEHVSPEKVRLVNAYGPTEATITCTVSDLTPDNLSSIGTSIKNVTHHLIDDSGALIKLPGVPGELCFSGVALSKGYWNRPEQTRKSFVELDCLDGLRCYRTGDKAKLDKNGDLHFLGRLDSQIKLRGFRIELDEVSKSLAQHPQVKSAVASKSDGERPMLVCFAVVEDVADDNSALQQELLEFMRDRVPHYMVPHQIVFYQQFPITVGDKVDVATMVAALRQVDARTDTVTLDGLSEVETQVMRVWESVLGDFPDSLDDTFVQSGGDSFAAMALAVGLETEFPGNRFGVSTFLSFPTVRSLARYISTAQFDTDEQRDAALPIITSIGKPVRSCDQCLIFFHPGGGSGYLYDSLVSETIKANYSVLIVESPLLTGEVPATISDTVLSIAQKYAQALLEVLGEGKELVSAGYSFGGLLAIEVARLLDSKGCHINRIVNLDQPPSLVGQESKFLGRVSNWMKRLRYPYLTFQDFRLAHYQRGLKKDVSEGRNDGTSEEARSEVLKDYYAEIEDRYLPEKFPFELCLVRGDVYEAKYDLPEDYGWDRYTNQLSVHHVTGTHSTLFVGPHHGRLVKVFDDLVTTGFKNND